MAVLFNDVSIGLADQLSHPLTGEKEQQRLCNIQRDDDAVHCRIMECMRDYKGKEETVKHLLDQYRITHESKHILLLLRIIYEQAVTRSVKAEHQDVFQILLPFDIGKSVFPKGV
ncbi:hypothetical protein Bca4012_006244 [Brassica carinata]|uniref:Uncharacterized protein n=2 Tax=Brassica TaxID=3705 RepID=A0A3P6B6I4_BRAOL|nr:unnamed protein product [Brassica napus]VDC96649.1 unnamed protein product [Brassica oleracea]